jgi:hypothetical protein
MPMFGYHFMLCRNGQPLGFKFNFATDGNLNFAVDSVFSEGRFGENTPPISSNNFLLLDGTPMLLLDGTDLLLLGS